MNSMTLVMIKREPKPQNTVVRVAVPSIIKEEPRL